MAEVKVVKDIGVVDGQNWEAYYLVANVSGFDLKLKLRANHTEKQMLELLIKEHPTNKK